ncbi:hypothetical protein [Nitrospirillum pindoramense]|uniref:Uncharacterized protein n=1 Tax=Nitrospirillum amazonense TaxID=28077 RepID=A0A560GVF3_9PROT|nr:hypothetical protein [Nitrospirillum amazonense]TWB38012.1 hypothetical protein FBZ90_1133 [Nitrospirillum amazonense]
MIYDADDPLSALQLALTKLWPQAERVPFHQVMLGEREPREAACEENVKTWVADHPECSAVRGWGSAGTADASGSWIRVVSHWVVGGPDGALYDITPMSEADRRFLRFIRHPGSDANFDLLKNTVVWFSLHQLRSLDGSC